MKSFIVSLVFFFVTVITISVNCFFVDRELSEILTFLKGLPEVSSEEQMNELKVAAKAVNEMWQNAQPFLSLSIENTLLRDCSVSFGNLEAFCESNSVPDYNAALSDCITRLSYLLRRERFSFKNAL